MCGQGDTILVEHAILAVFEQATLVVQRGWWSVSLGVVIVDLWMCVQGHSLKHCALACAGQATLEWQGAMLFSVPWGGECLIVAVWSAVGLSLVGFGDSLGQIICGWEHAVAPIGWPRSQS